MRDSLYILECLLEQPTSRATTEIMSDTAATDIIFGLFKLLGYQFSPQLAAWATAVSGALTAMQITARSTSSVAIWSTPI